MLKRQHAASVNVCNFAKDLISIRNKEFDQAMSLIVDDLKSMQKSLRGNLLLQLVEKIISV